ncbi:MAG: DUF5723 family protein [Rikenellaceae bacterium]|jgi:hypothetical protein|nr:DUF5723 family protein [Rikenellaceae bacterium]
MRKLPILIATALILATPATAQSPTSYFMEGSTLRSQYYPAFAPQRGYFNIPGLGGLNINQTGNITLDDIFYSRGGKLVTLLDSSVSSTEALANLKKMNTIGNDIRVNLIGFGQYTRNQKNFWSFDLNLRTTADLSLPYSLFEFLKTGKDSTIKDLGVAAANYLEAGFNYSLPLMNDKLYIGVRGKFLAGMARTRFNYDQVDISFHEDMWRMAASGQFDISAAGAGTDDLTHSSDGTYKIEDLDLKLNQPAGYGLAIDLGATYDILPDLQASLAVNDIGFINWDKKMSSTGLSTEQMEFSGMTVDQNGTNTQPDFNLDILKFKVGEVSGTTTSLRASLNAGLEYKLTDYKLGFGVLYSARFWEYKTLQNITGSVNYRPLSWLDLAASYSVIDNRGGAVGLALNLCPKWINLFLATDILLSKHTPQWVPISQSSMNVTLGLAIPMGKYGKRGE